MEFKDDDICICCQHMLKSLIYFESFPDCIESLMQCKCSRNSCYSIRSYRKEVCNTQYKYDQRFDSWLVEPMHMEVPYNIQSQVDETNIYLSQWSMELLISGYWVQAPCWALFVDRSFCPTWYHSGSVPKKHTEVYINYKLFVLLAQDYY